MLVKNNIHLLLQIGDKNWLGQRAMSSSILFRHLERAIWLEENCYRVEYPFNNNNYIITCK